MRLQAVGHPLSHSANPITDDEPPPLGEHSRAVLQGLLGLDATVVDGLAAHGVVQ